MLFTVEVRVQLEFNWLILYAYTLETESWFSFWIYVLK